MQDESQAIAQEKPQVIGGALVSSAGVTNLDTVAEEQTQAIAKGRKTSQNLSEMIKEEVAKH